MALVQCSFSMAGAVSCGRPCTPMWQASCISALNGLFRYNHGLRTIMHNEWSIPGEQDPPRIFRCACRKSVRDQYDMWFAHERPLFLAIYGLSLSASRNLAPVFAAFINTGQDWRWTLWWCAIVIGVAFLYCLFLMEETNYDRKVPYSPASTSFSVEPVNGIGIQTTGAPTTGIANLAGKTATTSTATVEAGQVHYPPKIYLQKLSIIDKKRPNRILDIMLAPFKLLMSAQN